MSFGEKLKRARKAKKLTQAEVAARLNKDFTSISKWENDKAEPDRETLLKLANLYDIAITELMVYTDEEKEVITKLDKAVPLDQIAKEHPISLYGKVLSEEHTKLMLMFAKTLLDNEKE